MPSVALFKTVSALGSLTLLAACTPAADDPHRAMLNKIERNVVLPSGAGPLTVYSRYYGPDRSGKIQALYVIQSAHYVEDARKFCAANKVDAFPCTPTGRSLLVEAGEREWVRSSADLPVPNGGGCQAVQFNYDPSTDKLSNAECNASN
jgi:hypothetical protein